jgi:hypothetical protein
MPLGSSLPLQEDSMTTFADLVASRKGWIEDVLKPWCQHSPRMQLRLAELEWNDIAGRVDPEKTLWAWAWGRFPDLVHAELSGIDESEQVCLTLRDHSTVRGFPDARQSRQGELVLLCKSPATGRFEEQGPFSIDDIQAVERISGQRKSPAV